MDGHTIYWYRLLGPVCVVCHQSAKDIVARGLKCSSEAARLERIWDAVKEISGCP
jgi:hypothetical protein